MEWYLKVVRDNYMNFEGRARRKEYWMFILVHVIIVIALSVIESMVGLTIGDEFGILSGIYALGVLLPTIAVSVRRLHDVSKSGWWILIGLIPLVGALVLLYFYVSDGKAGDNEYGPNPKGVAAPAQTSETPASTPPNEVPPAV